MKRYNVGDEVFLVWRERNEIEGLAKVEITKKHRDYNSYQVRALEVYYIHPERDAENIDLILWKPRFIFETATSALASVSRANKKRMVIRIFGRK